ncbi:MAG TPA: ATP-binding protein [Terriglobales bacterium]|nr:ATP-binding protein [Terriglobales bacterium]
MRFRLKTKLVIAITAMVVALISSLSYVYIAQLLRQRVSEARDTADFVAHQIYHGARNALNIDASSAGIDGNDPEAVRTAIEKTLQTDPGLNSLLQSIVGYSPIIYDAAISDSRGQALLHTDTFAQGKPLRQRTDFTEVLSAPLLDQVRVVYGDPKVYEVRLPLNRNGAPFGSIRVGISTVFLKNELQPQVNRTMLFAVLSILVSFAIAAALSTFALRPLEAIGRTLDRMTAGEMETAPEVAPARTDEYGVVATKIDRLGRHIRDVKEVFSAMKENLDQLMANLQDGLMLFTNDARVVLVSASAEQIVGRPRAEILGQHVDEVFSYGSRLGQVVLDAFHGHQSIEQREIITDGGRRISMAMDFIEEQGQRIGALLTMRDADSAKRLENEIELSRRLAAIGRLTSGVAHEVKNPINAIVIHLEVLREKLQQIDPDARRHMDVIGMEIQRLDRVVQTLVDFTRPVELRLGVIDLWNVVEEVAMLATPEAGRQGVHIERSAPRDPLLVKVDPDLVKQAVLNVTLNGIQAMPQGGRITIKGSQENGIVSVAIHDEGAGIPADVRDKIFNLYFTTKKKGTGIGLAMTYRVMQLHNGSVEFESGRDSGTTFWLRLPAVEARDAAALAPEIPQHSNIAAQETASS